MARTQFAEPGGGDDSTGAAAGDDVRVRSESEISEKVLSESTDLDSLMAAILGDDSQASERVSSPAVEPPRPVGLNYSPVVERPVVERPRPVAVEQPAKGRQTIEAELISSWRSDLDKFLTEQPEGREVKLDSRLALQPAIVRPSSTPISPQLTTLLPKWPVSRGPVLTAIGVATIIALGLVGWQMGSRPAASTGSPTTVRAVQSAVAGVRAVSPPPAPTPADRVDAVRDNVAGQSGAPATAVVGSSGTRAAGATVPADTDRARTAAPARPVTRAPEPARPVELTAARAPVVVSEPPPTPLATVVAPQPASTVAAPQTAPAVVTPQTAVAATDSVPTAVETGQPAAAPAGVTATVVTSALPTPPNAPLAVRSTQPRTLSRALPEYPSHLRRARIGGTVTVTLSVNGQGRVVDARSVSGPSPFFSAAEAAARRFQFEPATVNGKPQQSNVTVTFNFDPGSAPNPSSSPQVAR